MEEKNNLKIKVNILLVENQILLKSYLYIKYK